MGLEVPTQSLSAFPIASPWSQHVACELLNREVYVAAVRRQVDGGTNGWAYWAAFPSLRGSMFSRFSFLDGT